MAVEGMSAPMDTHRGVVDRALVVFHRPPPAAPAYRTHREAVHGLVIASEVVRPETRARVPVYVVCDAWMPPRGPISVQPCAVAVPCARFSADCPAAVFARAVAVAKALAAADC